MDLIEFEKLINQISARTGFNSDEIAAKLGYNKGYISQIKSRKKIPEKFINALMANFFPKKESFILEEEEVPYGNFDKFLDLIKSQQRLLSKQHETLHAQFETISSQQETIKTLALGMTQSKKAS